MDIKILKQEILKGTAIPKEQYLQDLSKRTDISEYDKEILRVNFDPPLLKDGELVDLIHNARNARMDFQGKGVLTWNPEEFMCLWKALKSPQYKRYILHLLGAYQNKNVIHPEDGEGLRNCCVCYKPIWKYKTWETRIAGRVPSEVNLKEWLSYFSDRSSTSLCLDCIAQLKYLEILLSEIEPDLVIGGQIYI